MGYGHVVRGRVAIDGHELAEESAAKVWDEPELRVKRLKRSEVLRVKVRV